MSEKINTGHYIRGYYIPNIRKLADAIISIMIAYNIKMIVEKVTEGGMHRVFRRLARRNLPPVGFTRTAIFSKIRKC